MFGRTEALTGVIIALSLAACVTDLLRGKIYNVLTAPGLLLGLAFATYADGFSGLAHALGAALLALALYGWLYALGVLGAGDVKFLAALGALGGTFEFVARVAVLGVLFGGALAFAILLVKGKLPDFIRRMRDFAYGFFVKELEFLPPKVDHRERMPFGIPIAAAAICVRVFGALGGFFG